MSDTPRTDAVLVEFADNTHTRDGEWVPADFARQLERELAEAHESAEKAHDLYNSCADRLIACDDSKAQLLAEMRQQSVTIDALKCSRDQWREMAAKLAFRLTLIVHEAEQNGDIGYVKEREIIEEFRKLKEASK